jgi:hypothetical protein
MSQNKAETFFAMLPCFCLHARSSRDSNQHVTYKPLSSIFEEESKLSKDCAGLKIHGKLAKKSL